MSPATRRRRRDLTTAARVLLCAAAVITPTVFDLGSVKPFDVVKITTVLFFGWLAFGCWVAAVLRGQTKPRRFLMAYLAGAYLLIATIATVFSPTKWTSLFGWYGRYGGLVTILVYVLIFYMIGCIYRERPDRVREIVYAIAAGAVVVTLYIVIQRIGLDPIKWARPSGEVPGQPYFGTMGNANFAGGYIGLTAPWLYLAFRAARVQWRRIAVVAWGLVELYALWLTSARNGMIALAAAVGMLLFIELRRAPFIVKAVAYGGAAIVALVAVALAVIVIWHPGSDRPPRALRRIDVLRSQTIQVRGYWWLAGLKMTADRPVFGWGPETFVSQYHRHLSSRAARLGDAETADKPHNVYVEHAAHTGVLGFIAYVGLLAVAFRRGFRRLRNAQRDEQIVLTTLLTLLAAYAGQAFFSIDVTAIGLVGWLVLGGLAALADPPERDAEQRQPPPRRMAGRIRVLSVAALVLGSLLAAVSTAPLKADHEARTARRLANDDAFIDEVLDHFSKAQSWQPVEPLYRGMTGDYLERKANASDDGDEKADLLTQAVDEFKEMDRLQPGYHQWKMTIGKAVGELAYVGGATFDEAFEWLEEASRLGPYDWRVPTNRGDVRFLQALTMRAGDEADETSCQALDDYERAVTFRPKAASAWLGVGKTLARLGHLKEARDALGKARKYDRVNSGAAKRLLDELTKLEERKNPPPRIDCG